MEPYPLTAHNYTGTGSGIFILHNQAGYKEWKQSAKAMNERIDQIIEEHAPRFMHK